MTYTADARIVSRGTVSAAAINAWFSSRGHQAAKDYAPDGQYKPAPADLGEMIVDLCAHLVPGVVFNHDLIAADVAHESAFWQSKIVRDKLNPSGLGATNDAPYKSAVTFATPYDGLRATVAHFGTYALPHNPAQQYDPRWFAVADAGWLGAAPTLAGLNGRWAYPGTTYGQQIAAAANALKTFAEHGNWNQEPSMAAPEIVRNILPWQASNTPGKTMVWDSITVHNTGNPSPGADAIMHGRWLQNLAKAGASEPSWQYTVDDTRIVQHLEDTQAGWHASDGDGPGNMKSLGFELCEIGDQDKVLRNAAWIIARKLHSKGLGTDMVFQHHDRARDKKNCPRLLRANNGAGWETLLAHIDRELLALGGGSSPAPDKWVIPGSPYGNYGFVAGFRATIEALAKAKYPRDPNAGALSITGYPLGDEYPTVTGSAQVCERCILLYDRNAQPPFDVTLAFRTAGIPPRKDDE